MKQVFLLFASALACTAQTSPTILKTVSLVNETELAGSPQSPVAIFTTTQDGFYRMTLLISTGAKANIRLCATYPMSAYSAGCVSTNAPSQQVNSVVFAFTAKAGSTIGFYTDPEFPPYTGTYNANLALEQLAATPAAP